MNTNETKDRREWMAVLARSPRRAVEERLGLLGHAARTPEAPGNYELLRAPEVGLCMVRGRVGGTGEAFNLGEMTMTRCVVRTPAGHVGFGYVAGRDRRHAELAALGDALMQDAAERPRVEAGLIAPLREALRARTARRAAETRASTVEFFTMVRGEDKEGEADA